MDWTPHMLSNVTAILANRLRGLPEPGQRWNRAQRDMVVDQQRDLINLAVQLLNELRRLHRAALATPGETDGPTE